MTEEFKEAYKNRHEIARGLKDQGRKIIGWVCTYVPEELLYAAGAVPVRITGCEGETPAGDAYLYSNLCSFVRGCFEAGFQKQYDYLDGYVTCNTCDHMRRLFDVWNRYIPTPFKHILGLPHKVTPASVDYYKEELAKLREALESALDTHITDDRLSEAIALYNRTRTLLRELYVLRKADPPLVSGSEVLEIVLAGMIMPKEEYNEHLQSFLKDLGSKPVTDSEGIRVALVGSELDNSEYVKVIEELGGIVVADDLCTGTRYFWDLVDTSGDPLEALAKRYLSKVPCSRMRPYTIRVEHIKRLIEEFNVQGIVFELLKFCDLYSEDYVLLRDAIRECGVPMLTLDREYTLAGVGQMRTRIEAFFESVEEDVV